MTEHKHAAVLRAIANGYPVQSRHCETDDWIDMLQPAVMSPLNFPKREWRIKPKQQPKTVVDRVLVEGVSYNEYGEGKPYSKRMNIDPRHIMPGDTLNIKVDVFL